MDYFIVYYKTRETIMDNMFDMIIKMKNLSEMYGTEETDYPYYHATFVIENLNEFIDIIMGFEKNIRKNKSSNKMLFRGMAHASWKLVPSIARNRNLELKEKELIHEFKYRYPDIFMNLSTNFERLSYMQHYGLPTRLLDFTENPLIALYFACNEMKKQNGRVLCLYDYITSYMNMYANILCDIACNSSINEEIDLYTKKYNISAYDFMCEMYFGYPYVLVRPPYWNERQKRQKSVFLIFNSLVFDAYGQAIYYGYDYDIEKTVRLSIEEHEDFAKIFENNKWKPNSYFTEKYSNKKTLSFVLDKSSWSLMHDSYKQEDINLKEKNFANRFRLHEQLESMEEDKMVEDFCSIIIPAKHKNSILKQLDFIGINESFVYPEITYVANEVKNKYM